MSLPHLRTAALAACLTLPAIALTGCAATNRNPPAGQGDPVPAPHDNPQISVLEESLRNWLVFQPAVVVPEERSLSVQIPVRNTAPKHYNIEYRILFYDAQGRQLDPMMGWQQQMLDRNQIVMLRANSLSSAAEDYRLEVRWANR